MPDTTYAHLLFLDIETVSGAASFQDLPDRLRSEWLRKASYLKNEEGLSDEALYFSRAGVFAEFGKIVAIGLGFFHEDEDGTRTFRVRTLRGHDEHALLTEFTALLRKKYPRHLTLCAHNGREFDYPFLCRRLLVRNIPIPKNLWNPAWRRFENPHLDTMDMWKFGDYKHYTSLELLAALFDIPSSKETLSGDQVTPAYYLWDDLEGIARYCREDVVVLARLFLRYRQLPDLEEDAIVRLD